MTEYGTHTGLEKVTLSSKDLKDSYLQALEQVMPQVMTEQRGADGQVTKAIDWDKLRAVLAPEEEQGTPPDSYEFKWVGKREAMAEAGRPSQKTLRPDLDESVNFEESENVFITGDNLEVLKILQESYLGKVDMIYIDPPYNTGNDLVYFDKFQQTDDEVEASLDARDEEGRLRVGLRNNEKRSARYHSNWLNMIYPRLVLARNLLKDSGVIFISIDDNEQANLKQVCDEVVGGENFVAVLPTIMKLKGNNDQFGFSGTHEYTLVYCKNKLSIDDFYGIPLDDSDIEEFSYIDEIGRYKQGATLMRTGEAGEKRFRPKGFYPIYVSANLERLSLERICKDDFEVYPRTVSGKDMSWRRSKETLRETLGEIIVKKSNQRISFYKKQRLEEALIYGKKPKSLFYKPEYSSGNGTARITSLFDTRIFNNPKPTALLMDFFRVGCDKNSLILDFFAGSYVIIVLVVKSLIKSRVLVLLHNIKTLKNSNLCVV